MSYDPSIYITPSHLPKLEVFLPDCTDLFMMDIPIIRPKLAVVVAGDRREEVPKEKRIVEPESAESSTLR